MGKISKDAIYDIIWVKPDKCHVMIARPDNFFENSKESEKIRNIYFSVFLKEIAKGTASSLSGANASIINLKEIIYNQVDKHNEFYK